MTSEIDDRIEALEAEIEDLYEELDYLRGEHDMALNEMDVLDDYVSELQLELAYYKATYGEANKVAS